MKFMSVAMLVLAAAVAAPAVAQEKTSTDHTMDILRDKVKADKKLLVAANLDLTDAEAKGFWPVYDAYQKDLQQINQRLAKAIASYADAYNKGHVSNETAKSLLTESLAIEDSEVKLKQSYVPKLEAVLPSTKVARYMQIENKVRAMIRYDLADGIPLIE
jgi:hypothetical protein